MSLLQAFKRLALGAAGKGSGLWHSYRLTRRRQHLRIGSDTRRRFTSLLSTVLQHDGSHINLSSQEQDLCARIRKETAELNRNNVTRTSAYWSIYESHPELHWAFLAHLVSRNGGWNMTDLKGQWLPNLMDRHSRELFFTMLEACNSLIFGDAYPQLRLYTEGRRLGNNLFHLLPCFGVSSFIQPFWDAFFLNGNPVPLTVALVINEQNVIQGRVVEDAYYRKRVFDTVAFRSQPYLQLNQIVFPLAEKDGSSNKRPLRLVGRVLEDFTDLRERIEFGKCLYAMLFSYPAVLEGAEAFARSVPHTGSRSDYWPHRFANTPVEHKNGMSDDSEHAVNHKLWSSPRLAAAWPDRPLTPASEGDWFKNLDIVAHLEHLSAPHVIDMTHEHLFGQYKLQTAVMTRQRIL